MQWGPSWDFLCSPVHFGECQELGSFNKSDTSLLLPLLDEGVLTSHTGALPQETELLTCETGVRNGSSVPTETL